MIFAKFARGLVPSLLLWLAAGAASAGEPGWPAYGGDQGGKRYSTAAQITPRNVRNLDIAWSFSTGDMTSHADSMKDASFENTPILADGKLFVCSPFNEVSAIDPGTGKQIWRFDPRINPHVRYANNYDCRGVAFWRDPASKPGAACSARVFMNSNERRIYALDARTGKPCGGFGKGGSVAVDPQFRLERAGEVAITSPPVVAGGLVIVGSSIDDNQRVDEKPGIVHAFDARTGRARWSFDTLGHAPFRAGAANVWAPMSVDEARGLVFLPTSSASPDFFGGQRAGDGAYADSVVALRIADGTVAWSFQITHHDIWDYDVPAQPTLGMVTYKGKTVPAVLQATKQGLIFTLARDTGSPVVPVAEKKVPQGGAPGEVLSPTQPFPAAPVALTPDRIKPEDAFGLTFWDRGKCREAIASARHEGLYTPPSRQGSLLYPFSGGGMNWGGIAFDEKNDIVYANTTNALHLITLIRRKEFNGVRDKFFDKEVSPQTGAPFGMKREIMISPLGLPCNPPPWGQLHAVDMHEGKVLWSVPLGTTEDLAPFSEYILGKTGTPNFGGPIVTAGGLVFIGAAMDNYLRAFATRNGKELWRGRLPGGGQATPMTYMWKGRQYVVIAAGGHAKSNTRRSDQIVAFALPN